MANEDDYRRRQRNRQAAQRKKERERELRTRRILIVIAGLLIVAVFIAIIVGVGGAVCNCSSAQNATQDQAASSEVPTEAPVRSVTDFITPQIPQVQDMRSGHYSASNGGIYILDKTAYELFSWNEDNADFYAETLNTFAKNNSGIKVYNILVPNHTEFGLPRELIEDGTVSTMVQADNIKYIYQKLDGVQPVNVYNVLGDHVNEYIYFNTDHHWTGLGAYYAYTAFCDQTNQKALDLGVCMEHQIKNFEGSLIDYDSSLKDNLDTVHWWQFPYETHARRQDNAGDELYDTSVYYAEEGEGAFAYGVFIWGDGSLFIEYNDDLSNGKKIAVVKESYGNAFVPYLTADYEQVHVIDFRYWDGKLSQYCKENGITEVLFLNNVMAANTAQQVDRIEEIM